MKKNDSRALDPLGRALMAYWQGDRSSQIVQEYRSGRIKNTLASLYFRTIAEFFPTERVVKYCKGHVLVVGAGTGVHALELENQGFQVTALEINIQAVQIMKERGVKDIRNCDFYQFSGESFDTLLLLGHNVGMCETVDGLPVLLDKCRSLMNPGGQLLLNSIDESVSSDQNIQGYAGEQEFRLHHNGEAGPWMRWLHVDFETLSMKAKECGFRSEKLIETEEGEYLARLAVGL